jgi:hypothetical protein
VIDPVKDIEPDDAEWIRRALDETGGGLDEIVDGASVGFVAALAPGFSQLSEVRARWDHFNSLDDLPRARAADVAWHLLWDGCNALIAAFVILKRGYQTEPMAITRGVLERVACAVVLFDNPTCLPSFLAGKVKAVDMIGPAGRVIEDLARVHGVLSELGAHVSPYNIGTSMVSRNRMAIGGRFPANLEDRASLGPFVKKIYSVAALLTAAPERIFLDPRRKRAILKRP